MKQTRFAVAAIILAFVFVGQTYAQEECLDVETHWCCMDVSAMAIPCWTGSGFHMCYGSVYHDEKYGAQVYAEEGWTYEYIGSGPAKKCEFYPPTCTEDPYSFPPDCGWLPTLSTAWCVNCIRPEGDTNCP